jgi:hypothetical protein
MTFSLLTDDDFEEESTLLVLDSPANPTLLRENVWRLVMSVTSGERSSEYWAKQRPHGLWERTSQDSLVLNLEPSSEESSVTWPRWGTAWGGVAMEHPTSAQSTEENGPSLLLPTPAANPPGKVRMEDIVDKDGNPPTHSGQRWYDKHTGRLVQKGLKEAVMLATPAAADAQGSHGGGQGRSLRTDIHTYKAETGESGTLNPSFVAAMMGFPDSWFEIE